MNKTPNLGLNRYTFDDPADIRKITEDNDLLDVEIGDPALLARLSEEGATNWDSENFNPDVKANKDSVYTKEEIGDPALLAKLSEEGATNWDSENFDPKSKMDKATPPLLQMSDIAQDGCTGTGTISKNQNGLVTIAGKLVTTSGESVQHLGTVPVGYRPAETVTSINAAWANLSRVIENKFAIYAVRADGDITFPHGEAEAKGVTISISYYAED